jgi:hypothetical protein
VSIRTPENRANFQAHVDKLRVEGRCQCFDHLRGEGFTPPLSKRRNHPCKSPHEVYGKDEGGQPIKTEGKGSKQDKVDKAEEAGSTPVERRHLKAAVANREVI